MFHVLSLQILCSLSDEEICQKRQNLYQNYPNEIFDSLSGQLLSFRQCFKGELRNITTIKEFLEFIIIIKYSSSSRFQEIISACYLILTVPVTVASAKRSFSKLKLMKTYLRNTIDQHRLSSLSITSIEN